MRRDRAGGVVGKFLFVVIGGVVALLSLANGEAWSQVASTAPASSPSPAAVPSPAQPAATTAPTLEQAERDVKVAELALAKAKIAAVARFRVGQTYQSLATESARLESAKRSAATVEGRMEAAKKWLAVKQAMDQAEAGSVAADPACVAAAEDVRAAHAVYDPIAKSAARAAAAVREAREAREAADQDARSTDLGRRPMVGAVGMPQQPFQILSVAGESDAICWYGTPNDHIAVWLSGWSTAGKADGQAFRLKEPVRVTGTKQYTGGFGTTQTVLVFEPYGR